MVSFLQVSLLKFSMNFWSVPRSYMPSLCGPLWLNHPNNIWWRVQIMKLIIIQFSASSCDFLPLRCKWTCHTSIVSTTELRDMILNVPASYSVGFRFESELGNGVSGLNVCSFSFGATGWMIGGSSPVRGWEFFSSLPRPDRFWGPPSLQSNGYQGVKRPGREADHSPPSSAKVKEWAGIYLHSPSTPHGMVLS
jgi:hypothetical protein